MVVGKIRDGPNVDSDAERARLARLAEQQEAQAKAAAEAEARRKEEERIAEERRIAEARAAEEKRKEEERKAEEKRKEDQRIAEEKRKEEERKAEEKRKEEQRIADEKRKEEERIAEEKRKVEEARIAEEKRKEAERLAEERRLAEKRRLEEQAAAEKARREEEERKYMAESRADFDKLNELPDPPILFDSFPEMGLRCISHRESGTIQGNAEGVKVIIGTSNLDRTRMLIKLEKDGKALPEYLTMCTMSYSKQYGPHYLAHAILPEAGEYALKLFCNNEGGKSGYSHVATYTVQTAVPSAGDIRFPKIHPAVPMALIEPLRDSVQAGSEVAFKVALGLGVTSAQVALPNGKRTMLTESSSGEVRHATGTVKIVSGDQNEGMVSIICQRDGGEEWLVFVKFPVV